MHLVRRLALIARLTHQQPAEPRTPDVQRSRAVGRSRSARISPSSTEAKYCATISLVTSAVESVAS